MASLLYTTAKRDLMAGTYTITAFTANLNLDLVLAATALQRGVTGVLGFLGE